MAPTGTTRVLRVTQGSSENDVVAPASKSLGRVTRATAGKLKLKEAPVGTKPRSVLGEIGNRGVHILRQNVKKAMGGMAERHQAKKEQDAKERKVSREKVVTKARFGSVKNNSLAVAAKQAPVAVVRNTRHTTKPVEVEVPAPVAVAEPVEAIAVEPVIDSEIEVPSESAASIDSKPTAMVIEPEEVPITSQPEPTVVPSSVTDQSENDTTTTTNSTEPTEEVKIVPQFTAPPIMSAPLIDGEVAPGIIDIDYEDIGYHEFVPEYVKDIYAYLHTVEVDHHVTADYMKMQTEITHKMRSILINWLVDVHLKFNLLQESLYLCVSLLDRYLSKNQVQREKLQLVGVSCMLIASKFEEIYAPEVRDFVYICEEAYTREEILMMERQILNSLKFHIGTSYALHFLRRMSKSADATPECHTMGKYLVELTITNPEMLKWLPSEIAAGCLFLSLKMLDLSQDGSYWSPTIEYYSGYTKAQVITIATDMVKYISNLESCAYKSTFKKYQSQRFYRIAYMASARVKEITLD